MKKRIVCIVIVMLLPSMLFALTLSNKSTNEILASANSIKDIEDNGVKMMLLSNAKKNAAVPFLCNLLLGCGIGSYIQGDTTGGTVALAGDILSWIVYYSGTLTAATAIANADYYGTPYEGEGAGAMVLGLLSLIGFRIYELARPFAYNKEYNRQLYNTCGSISFGVVPSFDNELNPNVTLSAKINL